MFLKVFSFTKKKSSFAGNGAPRDSSKRKRINKMRSALLIPLFFFLDKRARVIFFCGEAKQFQLFYYHKTTNEISLRNCFDMGGEAWSSYIPVVLLVCFMGS